MNEKADLLQKQNENVVSLKTTIESLKEKEIGYTHESSTLENGMNDNLELLQKENDRVLSLNSIIESLKEKVTEMKLKCSTCNQT